MDQTMTVSRLKFRIKEHHPDDHYFDRETMKFFGNRESEMYVHKKPIRLLCNDGKTRTAWVLKRVNRRDAFKDCAPFVSYDYFDTRTFRRLFKQKG